MTQIKWTKVKLLQWYKIEKCYYLQCYDDNRLIHKEKKWRLLSATQYVKLIRKWNERRKKGRLTAGMIFYMQHDIKMWCFMGRERHTNECAIFFDASHTRDLTSFFHSTSIQHHHFIIQSSSKSKLFFLYNFFSLKLFYILCSHFLLPFFVSLTLFLFLFYVLTFSNQLKNKDKR